MSEKEVALIFNFKGTLLDTSNIERATAFPSFLHQHNKQEGAVFPRMVVSCTVEYKQLTICTV
jgi:hypothetical protein